MNEPPTATVIRGIDIPFTDLIWFFVKCALAMIPATIIFSAIIWGIAILVVGGSAAVAMNPKGCLILCGVAAFCVLMIVLFKFTVRNLSFGSRLPKNFR
jgi:hypothetical protein